MKTFIVFLLITSIFSMKFGDLFNGCTSVKDVTSPVKVSNNGFLKARDSIEKNRKTYAESKANSQHQNEYQSSGEEADIEDNTGRKLLI